MNEELVSLCILLISMNDRLKKPDKERLLATLRGGIPDRVPCFEILIEPKNVQTLLG